MAEKLKGGNSTKSIIPDSLADNLVSLSTVYHNKIRHYKKIHFLFTFTNTFKQYKHWRLKRKKTYHTHSANLNNFSPKRQDQIT